MDGYNVGSALPSFHRGTALIDDPFNSFYEVVKNSPASFPRFILLLDGSPGMDLPGPPAATTTAKKPVELRHLKQTLLTAFARRVDLTNTDPELVSHELSHLHLKWIGFLQTQESRYPGITSIAKNLLATLSFGLQSTADAFRKEHQAKFLKATGLFEFAQYYYPALRCGAKGHPVGRGDGERPTAQSSSVS